mmetsp:Transcript_57897/g.146984  ORF Transcript_57897/g.146984 Transcript_57897/m.146984 type:complete len:837 (-) Transcript_57897:139-2649(-)
MVPMTLAGRIAAMPLCMMLLALVLLPAGAAVGLTMHKATHHKHRKHRKVAHGTGSLLARHRNAANASHAVAAHPVMTVDEALDSLPVHVGELFAQFTGGRGSAADMVKGLNEVYRRAQESRDRLRLQCRESEAVAKRGLYDARSELVETERSVTQLQDRMQSLQTGMDRSLAELQTLQDEFTRQRSVCEKTASEEQTALTLLKSDAPNAKVLVETLTKTCNAGGGTAPKLAECSLPDGSYLVTFEDEGPRNEIGKLSGLLERLMSLQLERSVRAAMANAQSLLQVGVRGRSLRGRHERSALQRHRRKRGRRAIRARERHFQVVQRRRLLRRKGLPTDICTTAQSPPCQSFADYLASFLGGVDDLIDELKVRMQVEDDRCLETLDKYSTRIRELKEQAEGAGVEIANLVSEQNEHSSTRHLRKERARDATREAQHVSDQCSKEMGDALSSMCGAKTLYRELSPAAGSGAFLGDCEVTDWVAGPCSKRCGTGGYQNLTRRVVTAPASDPLCPPLTGTHKCNEKPCPVDGLMSRWSEWGECSQACGGGTRTRHRNIVRRSQFGGFPLGETMQEGVCSTQSCDQDCMLSMWTPWSNCSKACSAGHRVRTRHVLRAPIGNGDCFAETSSERQQTTACNRGACEGAKKCASALDIVMALDISGSMGQSGVDATKEFTKSVAERTTFGDGSLSTTVDMARMGIVKFSEKAEMHSDLQNVQSTFTTLLASVTWSSGPTNIGEALAVAASMLEAHARPQAKQVIVIVTDGVPSSAYILSSEADKLRQRGVRLVFVMVGPGASKKAAARWASWPTKENLMSVHNFANLKKDETVTSLLANLCPKLE